MERIVLTKDEAEALENLARAWQTTPGDALRILIQRTTLEVLAGEVRDDDNP